MLVSSLDLLRPVELQAMWLDGDLVRFGPSDRDRYLPVDAPQTIRMRAAALMPDVPRGFVVAGATAAWVYDGLCPGQVLHVLAPRRRQPARGQPQIRVRYSRLHDDEATTIEALAIASLPRTLSDLANDPECDEARLRELWRSVPFADRRSTLERVRSSLRRRRVGALGHDRISRITAQSGVEPVPPRK